MTINDMTINDRPHPKKMIEVLGKTMSYVEMGDPAGQPIVFQHGNPTSSYLWRNIMPHVQDYGRCIALDLIGMGDSDKLDTHDDAMPYSFATHSRYFEAALEALNIRENIILVIHDWGSALGFDYANRHRDRVAGISYMEAIVRPVASWDDWPEGARNIFQAFRSPAGEELVLEKNIFVERVLPGSVMRGLTDAEMEIYRAPFLAAGEDRRPTLSWPRQIPIAGEPEHIVALVADYAAYMAENNLPKLFINAEPGSILTGAQRAFCRSWKNQQEVSVKGTHFIQEDSPDDIGKAIASWLAQLK